MNANPPVGDTAEIIDEFRARRIIDHDDACLLGYLEDPEDSTSLSYAFEFLLGEEVIHAISDESETSEYISFVHRSYLPKLIALGLVSWVPMDTGTAESGPYVSYWYLAWTRLSGFSGRMGVPTSPRWA